MNIPTPLIEAPRIGPVPEGVHRPRWSVMIPTFNCAEYLRQTLESVLIQDPGPEQMQIEVVDDCSTKDDPETVVREVGRGRVAFFRKESNEGATANFNTCLSQSRGEFVHILHGDDWVLPGFYRRIERAAKEHSQCAFYAVRCFFADEEGHYTFVTHRIPEMEKEPTRTVRAFYYEVPVQFAGIALRRSFYEMHGAFNPSIIHTADWEMWFRAVALGGGMVVPDVLAVYRIFAANETGRLMRSGDNLVCRERMIDILSSRDAGFDAKHARKMLWNSAREQERRFHANGDLTAAKASRRFWKKRASLSFRLKQALNDFRHLVRG